MKSVNAFVLFFAGKKTPNRWTKKTKEQLTTKEREREREKNGERNQQLEPAQHKNEVQVRRSERRNGTEPRKVEFRFGAERQGRFLAGFSRTALPPGPMERNKRIACFIATVGPRRSV